MKIYVDVLLIVNYVFDLVLLISVNYILRRDANLKRLLFGSLIGELTMTIAWCDFSDLCLIIFKFIVSLLMLLGAFGFKEKKFFIKNVIYFYLVSMLLGGAIYFLNTQFSYQNKGLVFKQSEVSINYGFIICLGFIVYYIFMNAFKNLKNNYSNYYKCDIYFDCENKINVKAFLDTGNKLKDPYSKKSIILIHEDMIKNIDCGSPLYVPFHSLNNHGLLKCYKALKIEIDGKSNDKFLVGVSQENFFIDGINCIINTSLMEGLK